MSSDSEYEEEEYHVFADFKNQLIPQEISSHTLKIIGIETKHPIVELNGNIFRGTYDHAMGTFVCFEKDNTEGNIDPLFEEPCRQRYKYLAKTNKVIDLQRIYLEKKQTSEENSEKDPEPQSAAKQKPNLKVSVSYEDAIRGFPVQEE